MPEPEPPRRNTRRVGPFAITYTKTNHRWDFHLGALLLLVTLMVIAIHEVIYSELPASEKEYPFFGILSHFGADMLALGISLSFMAVVFEHWRDK